MIGTTIVPTGNNVSNAGSLEIIAFYDSEVDVREIELK